MIELITGAHFHFDKVLVLWIARSFRLSVSKWFDAELGFLVQFYTLANLGRGKICPAQNRAEVGRKQISKAYGNKIIITCFSLIVVKHPKSLF
jgi:hypothetical protein